MGVDFYVAVPAGEWPTAVAVEQCASREGYPIKVGRFPSLDAKKVVTEGATVSVDGRDAYLEGELSPASLSGEEVRAINERLDISASTFRINDQHVLMSFRVRSPDEMRAASYVIASLVVCFGGYGFEPQGNTHGRADFAKSLIDGAALLKEP